MNKNDNQRLGTESIGKLIVSLAVPGVAAQLINVLYNIVDRIYIGHIPNEGVNALTGLGLCLPIIMLISAFSAFVGMGGAPLAAIKLGRGEPDEAEKILGNGIIMLISFSVILTVFFSIYKIPILKMFGASSETVLYGNQYLQIYLIGTVFVLASLGLNTFISCQGKAKIAMFTVLIGAVINIVLDPIFIFLFDMGVRGAALATIISQFVSAVWILKFLLSEKSVIRIRKKYIKPDIKVILAIAGLGISPFVMQSTESIVNIVLNRGLKQYGGDLYVGSLTVLQSVMQLIVVPIQGITQGIQPIISFNYGAGKTDRVKQTFKIMLIVVVSITVAMCLAAVIFPRLLASLFTDDIELINIVEKFMPIFFSGIWIFGLQMSCQTTFVGMGKAKISLFLALLRKIILLVPLAIILPKFFGVDGIYYSEPIADIIAAVTTGLVFLFTMKSFFRKS